MLHPLNLLPLSLLPLALSRQVVSRLRSVELSHADAQTLFKPDRRHFSSALQSSKDAGLGCRVVVFCQAADVCLHDLGMSLQQAGQFF